MNHHSSTQNKKNKKFLLISFIISIFLAVSKSVIGFLVGSPALIASSIDSMMDAISTSINRFILNISSQPADFNHPFGHGKFEAFSGLLQGIIIMITSALLLIYSLLTILHSIFEPETLTNTSSGYETLGIIIIILSIFIPLILSYYMKKQAEHSHSLVLEAEHSHFFADGIMNSGVLLALVLSYTFEVHWIDSLVAICISLWLMWDIRHLLIESFNVLTDKKLSCTIIQKIENILKKEVTNNDVNSIKGWHDLQTRRSGSEYHINVHLEFTDDISLSIAHEKSDIIEEKIKNIFPNAIILTHFDLHSEYLPLNTCMK